VSDGSTAWFALVDGAADPEIAPLATGCRDQACLLSGRLAPDLAAASPYLAKVDPHEALLHVWQERGVGQAWGVLIESELSLMELRKLLRSFLQAKLPDGEVVMFRFYDPRVFRGYLPTASAEQRAAWFKGVRQYVVEAADGGQHSFRWRGGQLVDGDRPVPLTA
jgi:hypothetical protein